MEATRVLTTWQAVFVAVLGAILWGLPFEARWERWHHSIGLLLVLAVSVASALIDHDLNAVVNGALQGMAGLGVSWVLVETTIQASAVKRRLVAMRRPPDEARR
jgi:hypothetical protein